MPTTHVDRRSATQTKPLLPDKGSPTSWETARKRLETAEMYRTYWLTTLHEDGRPHAMPILGLWQDGVFYFITSEKGGRVEGGNAPTAGPPPYAVWALTPEVVFGLPGVAGTDETGQAEGAIVPTRWQFKD